jgi:glycosyltransferase involved in cell wall biosynthesis
MTKIYVNHPNENWILDTIAGEFKRETSLEVAENLTDADIIWHLGSGVYEGETQIPQICTQHHIVPWKMDQFMPSFKRRDRACTAWFTSNWRTKAKLMELTDKRVYLMPYWVDTEFWRPEAEGYDEAREELGLHKDDFVIGSFQRDTEGQGNCVPKQEKGPDIFVEWVKKFRDVMKNRPIVVLLGGYRRDWVIQELEKEAIPYVYKEMADRETLRTMYTALSVYLVGSRVEGGPQALLECSSMIVPILSTDVGMADVILHPNQITSDRELSVYSPTTVEIFFSTLKARNHDLKFLRPMYDIVIEKICSDVR